MPVTNMPIFSQSRNLPTGEPIVDAVIDLLRTTSITQVKDISAILGIERRGLGALWRVLTGSTLQDTIATWRRRQALELLEQAGYRWEDDAKRCDIPRSLLQDVAQQCGWRNAKVLKHALRRSRTISSSK